MLLLLINVGDVTCSVVTAINLVALPQHFELHLTVESIDKLLVLWIFTAHWQMCHVSLVHRAELCRKVGSLATPHDSSRILDVVAELEQRVWRLTPQIVIIATVTLILALRLELALDKRVKLGLSRAEKTAKWRSLLRVSSLNRFQVFLQSLLRVHQ